MGSRLGAVKWGIERCSAASTREKRPCGGGRCSHMRRKAPAAAAEASAIEERRGEGTSMNSTVRWAPRTVYSNKGIVYSNRGWPNRKRTRPKRGKERGHGAPNEGGASGR
eukprot:7387265-Prymnesium_polylepis.1